MSNFISSPIDKYKVTDIFSNLKDLLIPVIPKIQAELSNIEMKKKGMGETAKQILASF